MEKNEYVLTKEDIANYLYDFSFFMDANKLYYKAPFWANFVAYMRASNRYMYASQSYYMEMINVFIFYLIKEMDSIQFDADFKNVSAENIEINKDIFINPDDAKKFNDKKRVLKLIRNVINHNDNKELYVLKRINGQLYIEINLLDTRTNKEKNCYKDPIPFHVLISLPEYYKLMSKALFTDECNRYILDIKKDLSSLNSKNCMDLLDNLSVDKVYPHDNKNNNDFKSYNLTYSQKRKIQQDLKVWEKLGANGRAILQYLVMSALPIPELKKYNYGVLLYLVGQYFALDKMRSLEEFSNEADKKIILDEIFGEEDTILLFLKEFNNIASKECAIYDWDLFSKMSCFIYCGYIFDTIVNDEEITIGNKKYPRNKVRNSFVHSRWIPSFNSSFEFFDWINDRENEYNPKSTSFWREIISWDDIEIAAKSYHDKINSNHLINFPMTNRAGIYSNQYSEFSFTEDGLLWKLVTHSIYDIENELPWGIYCYDNNNCKFINDDNQIEYFLSKINELQDTSTDIKRLFYQEFKKRNKVTRDYYNKLISK